MRVKYDNRDAPCRPATLVVFTMRPYPCAVKIGHAAALHAKTLSMCTCRTASKSACVWSDQLRPWWVGMFHQRSA